METYNDWLAHHGIKGMNWGKRNGPPYPLSDDQRTAEENRKNPTSISAKEKYGRRPTVSGTGSNVSKKESANIHSPVGNRKDNSIHLKDQKSSGVESPRRKKLSDFYNKLKENAESRKEANANASVGNSYYNSISDENEDKKRLLESLGLDDGTDEEASFERLAWASYLKLKDAEEKYKDDPSAYNAVRKKLKEILSDAIGSIYENSENRANIKRISAVLAKMGF